MPGTSFKPHQRGGGCCSVWWQKQVASESCLFQTPSAGRWVLQPAVKKELNAFVCDVSNPISGEVGAAASSTVTGWQTTARKFQTPSAGRWVLQLRW